MARRLDSTFVVILGRPKMRKSVLRRSTEHEGIESNMRSSIKRVMSALAIAAAISGGVLAAALPASAEGLGQHTRDGVAADDQGGVRVNGNTRDSWEGIVISATQSWE